MATRVLEPRGGKSGTYRTDLNRQLRRIWRCAETSWFSTTGQSINNQGGNMINSLIDTIFGCSHKRTTFPLTPSRKSKASEGARSNTYVVCLNCGKEFDYNWEEMRIVSPIGVPP